MQSFYSILIRGSGPCCQGTPQSADIAGQALIKQLEAAGHKLETASIVVDGNALPIVGQLEAHPKPEAVVQAAATVVDPDNWGEVLTLLRRIDEHTTPQVQAPKKKKVAAGDEKAPPPPVNVAPVGADTETPALGQQVNEPPPPARDVVQGICTRCGGMFEGEEEEEDHLSGPMCEAPDQA